jgi:hypothetical protein
MCLATSQAVLSGYGDAVSDIFSGGFQPRLVVLLLQLFIPAWISGNLRPLFDLINELRKRVLETTTRATAH